MNTRVLVFEAPRRVSVRVVELGPPSRERVLVRTLMSAISAGTEMLVYRGEIPADVPLDATIPSLHGTSVFPVIYGYAAVGEVCTAQPGLGLERGDLVFAFQPHRSHFLARPEELWPVPAGINPEDALLFANLETALSLVHDAAPLFGERIAVIGQGVVGLLCTALLRRLGPERLVCIEPFARRRGLASRFGADLALAPSEHERAREALGDRGADLVLELSGQPSGLDLAVALAGYDGRVVVGSWYGDKRAAVDLGTRFHRNRIRISSSQVSTIDPRLRGRWDKTRRMQLVSSCAGLLHPSQLITHRVALAGAQEAYEMLDRRPDECVQVVLTY